MKKPQKLTVFPPQTRVFATRRPIRRRSFARPRRPFFSIFQSKLAAIQQHYSQLKESILTFEQELQSTLFNNNNHSNQQQQGEGQTFCLQCGISSQSLQQLMERVSLSNLTALSVSTTTTETQTDTSNSCHESPQFLDSHLGKQSLCPACGWLYQHIQEKKQHLIFLQQTIIQFRSLLFHQHHQHAQ